MWAAIVIIVIALLLVLAAPKPKIENARAANLGDWQFPRSKEGDPVAWFLGTVRMKSPNSLWYGDYKPVAITKKQKTGMFSSKRVTVGYKYHVGLDLCWALGGAAPVTLRRLWSDKYVFWQGVANTAQTILISGKQDLFGGPDQRGGLAGQIDFYPGTFDEERNAYLAQKADPDVPAYIGQCRTVFRGRYIDTNGFVNLADPEKFGYTQASGFYFGTSVSINSISAELSRYTRHIHPVYSVMPNGLDMNPMELMYAGFTQRFGMLGTSPSDIDMPSWLDCATKLYNEGLGMSLLIQQSITGKDLCEEVLRIADGILYQDDNTGKMVAVLIREDYVVADLPVLDNSIVEELVNFTKTTWDQTYNQCRVTFKDRSNDYADRAAVAQDFANINFQNRVRNTDISMPGCFVNGEANQLAVRQLSLLSVPLFQIEIRCNRRAASLKPGKCFVFNWKPYGISNMVMRVQKIDKGTLEHGVVTIYAVQDRFATALAVFAPPTGSGWTPIDTAAKVVTSRKLFEVPKWFWQFFEESPAETQAAWYVAAKPPGDASVSMDVERSASGDYSDRELVADDYIYNGSFVLAEEFPASAGRVTGFNETGFKVELVDLPQELIDRNGSFDPAGQWLIVVGEEFMQVADLVDNGDMTYQFKSVYRALLDSTFESHGIGTRGFIIKQSDGLTTSLTPATGISFNARIIDNTPTATLDPDLAIKDVIQVRNRAFRPLPHDYVTINGTRTGSTFSANSPLEISWTPRNRNSLNLMPYNAANAGAESNTLTYLRHRINGGAWIGVQDDISTNTATVTATSAGELEVQVWSKREGQYSLTGDSAYAFLTDTVEGSGAGFDPSAGTFGGAVNYASLNRKLIQAASSTGSRIVSGSSLRSTGKRKIEMFVSGSQQQSAYGIGVSGAGYNGYLGGNGNSAGIWVNYSAQSGAETLFYNGGSVSYGQITDFAAGAPITIYAEFVPGEPTKIWIAINGVMLTGDPEAGTGPICTLPEGALVPLVDVYYPTSGPVSVVYNGESETITDTLAPSFLGWDDESDSGAGPHAYWRLYVNAVDGGSAVSFSELQFRKFEGVSEIPSGGISASSSSFGSEYSAEKLFDGSISTIWASSAGAPQWVSYVFPEPRSVQQLAITSRPDGGTYGQTPSNFTVQYSDDGINWLDAWTVASSTGWSASQTRTFSAS